MEKKYLYIRRRELIWELLEEGYSKADISRLFNVDPSVVTRIATRHEKEHNAWRVARGLEPVVL